MIVERDFYPFVGLLSMLGGCIVMHIQKLPEGKISTGRQLVRLIMGQQVRQLEHFFHVSLRKQTAYEQENTQKQGRGRFHGAKIAINRQPTNLIRFL